MGKDVGCQRRGHIKGSDMKLTHGYVNHNGVRLHYVTLGAGPSILFLHGNPEFWYAWKHQLTEFARDHRVVALDMRGFNLSSKPSGVDQYGQVHLVEDVRALADHLGLRPFTLVGHDLGGVVAWAFALTHPGYLEHLIIINAPHPAIHDRELRTNPAQQAASQYLLELRSQRGEHTLAAALHSIAALLRAVGWTKADIEPYWEAWAQPGWMTGACNYYRAAGIGPPAPDSSPANGNYVPHLTNLTVTVPTLVIWGAREQFLLPSHLDGLAQYVPDLTTTRITNGSHWLIHEQPDCVNRSIRAFLIKEPP
jgi:pimeloyl-ACP methyl ester carboxylesterase